MKNTPSSTSTPTFRKPRKVGKLYRPVSGSYRCANWYTRVYIRGKQHRLNLGLNKHTALELDREIRARLREGESLLSVMAYVAKRLERSPAEVLLAARANCPTIGDIISAHEGAYFGACPRSTRTYRRSLLNLVETVVRHRRGLPAVNRSGRRVTIADYTEILDLPVSLLDDVFLAEFRACRMSGVPRGTQAELSAQGSVNAEVQFVKAMFSHEAMTAYKAANLRLPDMTSFLQAKGFPRRRKTYVPPQAELVVRIHAGLRQLSTGDDEVLFIVLALALHGGLRRGEILNAQWDWLQCTCGPAIVVKIGPTFLPKSRCQRTIPVPEWLFLRLRASPPGYLLGTEKSERDAAYKRALAWLRANGLADCRKPLHFLRALYAGYLVSRLKICDIKGRLGHGDIATTFQFYAEHPFTEAIASLWEVALTSTPVRRPAPVIDINGAGPSKAA